MNALPTDSEQRSYLYVTLGFREAEDHFSTLLPLRQFLFVCHVGQDI